VASNRLNKKLKSHLGQRLQPKLLARLGQSY
jgi:hypothetical protein